MKKKRRVPKSMRRDHPLVGRTLYGYFSAKGLGHGWRLVTCRAVKGAKGQFLRIATPYEEFMVPAEQAAFVMWRGEPVRTQQWLERRKHG